nr:unnamed protein product [Digitaria exilis]
MGLLTMLPSAPATFGSPAHRTVTVKLCFSLSSVNRSIGGCTTTDTSLGMSTTAVYTDLAFPTLVTVRVTVMGCASRFTTMDG